MYFPIKNRQKLKDLKELASSKNQVEELRLQDKISQQKFLKNVKKLYEPLTNTIKTPLKNQQKLLRKPLLKTTKHSRT